MEDFLAFRRMVTPILVQILYWALTALAIIGGLIFLIVGDGAAERVGGLLWMLLGPLVIRVYAEFIIIAFRINETLSEIRRELRERRET